jgi:hypothetical protein
MTVLPETLEPVKPIRYEKPTGEATGYPALSRVREGGGPGRHVVKSCLPTTTITRENDGADYSRV